MLVGPFRAPSGITVGCEADVGDRPRRRRDRAASERARSRRWPPEDGSLLSRKFRSGWVPSGHAEGFLIDLFGEEHRGLSLSDLCLSVSGRSASESGSAKTWLTASRPFKITQRQTRTRRRLRTPPTQSPHCRGRRCRVRHGLQSVS